MRPSKRYKDLGIFLFLGITAAGSALVLVKRLGTAPPSRSDAVQNSHRSEGSAERLFYTVIGQTPGDSEDKAPETMQVQYTLEISEAPSEREAIKIVWDLKKKGIEAFFTPLNRAGRVVYRVRNGIYGSESEAAEDQQRLAVKGLDGSINRL